MQKSISLFVGGLLAVSLLSVNLRGDEAAPATQPANPMGDPAAMMAAMQAYATPGAEHAELAKWVGEWTTQMEDLTPGMGNEKSTGSSKVTMIMGGRYMMEEFHGSMMGQPFDGMSITGFDNKTKQYFTTWIDNMSTGVAVQYGTMASDVMNMKGECTCPVLDKPMTMVTRIDCKQADTRVMEMTMTTADGQPMGAMRITYTRKK